MNTERELSIIAQEILEDWKNPYFGAVPYIEAMETMRTIDEPYFADSGSSIVAYFLANANSWRGEKARQIKKELNAMLKQVYGR